MSKKIKTVFALGEDFKVMISLVPKLEAFIKGHREIAEGYQKYRKNGGAAIPGVEKYLGGQEIKNVPAAAAKEPATAIKIKTPKKPAQSKIIKKTTPVVTSKQKAKK